MLTTLFIHGIKVLAGLTVILGGWLCVQAARRRVFGQNVADDELPGCHGCAWPDSGQARPCGDGGACRDDRHPTLLKTEDAATSPSKPGG